MVQVQLSKEKQEIYKRYLTTVDREAIAEESGYSASTVHKIMNGKTPYNRKSERIIEIADRVVSMKVSSELEFMKAHQLI